MIIIVLLIFVLLSLFSRTIIKDKLIFLFLQIYLIWWAILLCVSNLNPYGLYAVSNDIYGILILSVFSFSVGYIINYLSSEKKAIKTIDVDKDFLEKMYNNLSESKIFIGSVIVYSVFISRYLLKYQQIIAIYGTEEARTMRFYAGAVFNSTAEVFFYNFFVESYANLIFIFVAFSFVWMRFNKTFFFSLLFIYLYSSFGAGRFSIIELGFYILFFYIVKSKIIIIVHENEIRSSFNLKATKIQRRKTLLLIFPILSILYIYSIYLSNYRNGIFEVNSTTIIEGNDGFFEHIIVYCVGSFRALEYGINNYALNIGETFGSLSFGGIDEILGVILNVFGIKYSYANSIYGLTTGKMIPIGNGQMFNALFTNVFGQYLDFGLLGIILLSFFWGIVINKQISVFQRNKSIYSLFVVAFMFVTVIMTPLTWKLQAPSSWIFLSGLYMMKKRF